jgi:hypothetical protein
MNPFMNKINFLQNVFVKIILPYFFELDSYKTIDIMLNDIQRIFHSSYFIKRNEKLTYTLIIYHFLLQQ